MLTLPPRRIADQHRRFLRGFSFVEALVAIAVLGVLVTVMATGFRNLVHHESLESATEDLYTALSDARSATLASEFGEQFGVHIEDDRFIRFRGAAYDPSASTNNVVSFSGVIATTTLSGGPTIVFAKQTGTTTNSGTIKLIQQITSASTTMTLYTSGIVSIP